MKYYKQKNEAAVGSYMPSKDWSKFTHFAVMDDVTNGMLASVGYFQRIENPKKWGFKDYLGAAESIEQAHLYANAPKLLELAKAALNHRDNGARNELANLINKIEDISEPVNRLLGEHAMEVIEQAQILENRRKLKSNGKG